MDDKLGYPEQCKQPSTIVHLTRDEEGMKGRIAFPDSFTSWRLFISRV